MADQPKESDWKIFSANVARWRELYLAQRNRDLVEVLSDTNLTSTDQFWITKKKMEEEAEILQKCFGELSRSKLLLTLHNLCVHGFIPEEDLDLFSETLCEKMHGWLEEAEGD